MNIKSFILFLTIFSFSLLFSTKSNGQNVYKQNNVDSAAIQKRVQQEYIARDSILNALKQKKINDSIARVMEKIKIQQYRDSLVQSIGKAKTT